MTRIRLTAEQRKAAIIKAAIPLFAKHGFNGTTTRQISAASHVSEALLYRHFPSKEAIYDEIKSECSSKIDLFNKLFKDREPSTETFIRLIEFLVFSILMQHRGFNPSAPVIFDYLPRLMLQSLLEDGAFAREFLGSQLDEWRERSTAAFEAAKNAGDLVVSDLSAVNGMWFIHHLTVMLRCMRLPQLQVIDYENESELFIQVLHFCLRGIGLKPEIIARYSSSPAQIKLFCQDEHKG